MVYITEKLTVVYILTRPYANFEASFKPFLNL